LVPYPVSLSSNGFISPNSYSKYVESIFFPVSGGPSGDHKVEIIMFEQRGTPDNWELVVVADKQNRTEAFSTDSGSGQRVNISFSVGDAVSTDTVQCSTPHAYFECRQDSDCAPSEQATKRCVNRQCISNNARTIRLTWFGSKFVVAFVC
jgi:hypothetical protein